MHNMYVFIYSDKIVYYISQECIRKLQILFQNRLQKFYTIKHTHTFANKMLFNILFVF